MNDNVKKGFAVKPTFDSKSEEPKSLGGLLALNRLSVGGQRFGVKHVYAGTVPAHVKHHRRAKNKAARMSRRANRG
jgi:hypothetical protein